MLILENIADILEVAVRLERAGLEFYKKAYEEAKDYDAKSAFNFLAAEEEKHIGFFRNLLEQVADYEPKFKYPGEYELYLDGLAHYAIKAIGDAKDYKNIKDSEAAINKGIQMEFASILFYSEIYQNIDDDNLKKMLEEVMNEEKNHVAKLIKIRKEKLV